jgi:hypothetical protein
MARDKESMQDIALYHIDRINRANPTTAKSQSLSQQLNELKKTPEQIRKESTTYDWVHNLRDYCVNMRFGPGARLVEYVQFKYKEKMQFFHESGASFKEVTSFILSKEEEHMNN